MLFIPRQRRPPLTCRRERYDTTSEFSLASFIEQFAGWEVATVQRLSDGAVEAVYLR